ncbi:hypothetical protein OF001_U360018 [Pseudomonas sp. OF001]|nr:hypothetical protein OF001_U360018 [Pseudomonas sp. OF001]
MCKVLARSLGNVTSDKQHSQSQAVLSPSVDQVGCSSDI